jgi:hypothetical protein
MGVFFHPRWPENCPDEKVYFRRLRWFFIVFELDSNIPFARYPDWKTTHEKTADRGWNRYRVEEWTVREWGRSTRRDWLPRMVISTVISAIRERALTQNFNWRCNPLLNFVPRTLKTWIFASHWWQAKQETNVDGCQLTPIALDSTMCWHNHHAVQSRKSRLSNGIYCPSCLWQILIASGRARPKWKDQAQIVSPWTYTGSK